MNVTVDWKTKIIHVAKSELILVQASPTEIYEMGLNDFRLALKAEEASEIGMSFLDTHRHNVEVLLGGITYARVIEIINGYTITFEDGQYAVNLVGANSNVGDVVNVNQVSIRSNNSAGLITSADIEHISFGGAVNIDEDNITGRARSGVIAPVGTLRNPVDNVEDALMINAYRGFNKVRVWGHLDINSGHFWDVENLIFEGTHPRVSSVYLENTALTANCVFKNLTVTGTLDGNNQLESCVVTDLIYFSGQLLECELQGSLQLGGSAICTLTRCSSGATFDNPVADIDMNGSGRDLVVHDFCGPLTLKNLTGNNTAVISFNHGQLIIDSTVTAGAVVVLGNCEVINNSTGTAVVDTRLILSGEQIADCLLDEVVFDHLNADSLGAIVNLLRQVQTNRLDISGVNPVTLVLFADDNVTPIKTWILKDKNGNPITLVEGTPATREPQ